MQDAFICDAVRAPIGRYGGTLSAVHADDLSAIPLAGLVRRNPDMAGSIVDDVIYGCANQAGEDNRNVARMAVLLAVMPVSVPGTTVNRLCRSGMAAEDMAARAIRSGDCE
ncbi:acetyl-CoA acetyltransferase [Aquamicrobium lusatiense]|uniref:Acetyl-CoA acetyltransferase n=1 Tax=Aquamicrobium lusatiense TaxID=89772 RepID=A0A7W9S5I3_9HYPH|nr:acetyl-CoA acetyltransferase [Aquamicrobium lusatiense]